MMKFFRTKQYNGRCGFTLMEVLLAVMIVGLIGVALASLARSAARESGVGRSKILLRNNLASFMRTLRKDLSEATVVIPHEEVTANDIETSAGNVVQVLKIGKNVTLDGEKVDESKSIQWILYCFKSGADTSNIVPAGATRAGDIYRYDKEVSTFASVVECVQLGSNKRNGELILDNVKYIPNTGTDYSFYPVPFFGKHTISRQLAGTGTGALNSSNLLTVHLITELPSTPIVNEVIEEEFTAPMGY